MPEDADALVAALLDRHGRTFSDEIGITLAEDDPDALFQWLVAALLYSARIGAGQATKAAKALIAEGLGTPAAMAEAGWDRRVKVLNENGYARFDERTASMLGDVCDLLRERWDGDLRNLRAEAERDPARELKLLKEFKGVGDVGAAVFAREAQAVWPELFPFADKLALKTARDLGLPDDPGALAKLTPREDFPRLVAALVGSALAKDQEAIAAEA